MLSRVHFQNLLSFGPSAAPVELGRLNVLIGPNGSGKSNFLEGLALLPGIIKDFPTAVRAAGGIRDFFWKGQNTGEMKAGISWEIVSDDDPTMSRLCRIHRYTVQCVSVLDALVLAADKLESDQDGAGFQTVFATGRLDPASEDLEFVPFPRRSTIPSTPDALVLSDFVEQMAFYRSWTFGRGSLARVPQPADLPNDILLEDGTNLGLILSRLRLDPKAKRAVIDALRLVFDGIVGYEVSIQGNLVQIFLEEEAGWLLPATRLSDGTLRWLSLLAVLLDPTPPLLVAIEEPELGLHPDLLPKLAEMLKEASTRTQIVVTTHSEILIDALSASPEDVLVCERVNGSTTMTRLDGAALAEWLKEYRLGQLWSKGVLGGNRW